MGFGNRPPFTTNLAGLEAAAARVLPDAAERHLLQWAGGAAAVRANAEALERWRIVPRMFVDREKRPTTTTLFGTRMPAPILLGPVGRQDLAHREAEGASARAAAVTGLTYVHASSGSAPIEGVALAAPLVPRWFAVDWPGRGGPDAALLRRARLSGCTVLLLGAPQPGADWAPLNAVRAAWDGPVVLGGIQTAEDARAALRRGVDGVLVSNERGRRGAEPIGTIDALPAVVDAVAGTVPVLFGSGVRTGTDVYRALALGADAVVLGRPYVHGLALGNGAAGVEHVLRTLLAELDITLAVAGARNLAELGRDALVRT
ncbi:MAG: alpha-hydroxy-acid oxidizing protein [Actinobacteria bacterium]|nr:alpha-hydroxy-acid oxidizing protein [Actinomycetota bacterium]